ncbi:MAG TPA: copper resistance protein CopC [Thermomicrobiales bacterium]|nr:copper resistance protein CopC [Thermomicrobiales bacterium]
MTACFRWTWRCALLFGLLTALLVPTVPAHAHAELASSAPGAGAAVASAPADIELRFTETVNPSLSSMALVRSDGTSVALGSIALDANDHHIVRASVPNSDSLAPGVYTVVWGAYSAEDGHASSGSFTFSVGTGEMPVQGTAGSAGASDWSIAGKWLELIGLVLLTGLACFGLVNGRALVAHRPVVLVLPGIAIVGALLSFRAREVAVSGGSMLGGIYAGTFSDLLGSTYGQAWLVRLAALVVALVTAWLLPRYPEGRLIALLLACGALGLASIAVSGHAGAADPAWLAALVDLIHLAAASVWLGGLLGLLVTLSPAANTEADRLLLSRQGNRFIVAVVIVVLAGVASAYWHIDGRRSLQHTDYGRTLLFKIAIVAAILGVAWYNRRVLQAIPGRPRWIPLAVGLELVMATVVLLFSADLSQTPPANQPLVVPVAARALELSESAETGASTVSLSGVLTGDPIDVVTVSISPATGLQRVIVRTSLETEGGETVGDRFDAAAVDGKPSVFVFPAGRLGIAGPWQVEVTVRRAGVEDEVGTLPIDTSQLAVYGTRVSSDAWSGFRVTTHTGLALVLAAAMLAIGLGGLRRITGLEPLASAFLLAASLVIAGGFVVSAARSVLPVTPGHSLSPPVDSSTGAITYVGDLYLANCAICHGAGGRGAGTSNLAHLHGNAADLTGGSTEAQSDGDLFYWIGDGVPGTRMPAFDQALSTGERWKLVQYIRQLQSEAREADAAE